MAGPLSHLRVLDLSRVLAGPWASQNLADLGAEVIKVERPDTGDDTRGWGPPFLKDREGTETGESAYYLSVNRGKKSLALDISRAEGQAVVRDLAAKSDILIENFKVGGLARYGLGYDDLKAVNPGLIYCSITGFGQTGPYKDRPGYDFMIQAMGGMMSVTGERDDLPGGGPQKVGVAVADITTGMYALVGVLAALVHRERTGEGQYIDLALMDCVVNLLANHNLNYFVSGSAPQRMGNAHQNVVPYQSFATADGHIVVAVGNDAQFARFCQVIDQPEHAGDIRYKTMAARIRNRHDLVPVLEHALHQRTSGYWLAALEAANVPCGPINTIADVFEDAQVRHRGLRIDLPHPLSGTAPAVANPINYSRTAVEYGAAAPGLGEHTDDVLENLLGLTPERISTLRAAGIIR